MGNKNLHLAERAREEADEASSKWGYGDDLKWSYTKEKGPDTWWMNFPDAAGDMQSPVNIVPEKCIFDDDLARFALEVHYGDTGQRTAANNGYTIIVYIRSDNCWAKGGPMGTNKYQLEQLHFHWGPDDKSGSEHTINRRQFSGEVHLVHWNSDYYRNYEEAARMEDGLCVLSVFMSLGRKNPSITSILEHEYSIEHRGQRVQLNPDFRINNLLPDDLKAYFTYHGSLTKPPCWEGVNWIIFADPVTVSSDQLDTLRKLKSYPEGENPTQDEFRGRMRQNIRPTQDLNGRKISTLDSIYTKMQGLENAYSNPQDSQFTSGQDFNW